MRGYRERIPCMNPSLTRVNNAHAQLHTRGLAVCVSGTVGKHSDPPRTSVYASGSPLPPPTLPPCGCEMHVSHACHMREPSTDARIWTCDVW